MQLIQVLQPSCIKVPLVGTTKEQVIDELIELLYANGLIKDRNSVADAVFAREKTRSTGIGSGIAIPHGKCRAVDSLAMAMGITAEPIDFQSVDDKPVRIVMLLVSRLDQAGPHIQALARISRLMLDEAFRSALERATSSQEVYELISNRDSQQ